MKPAISFSASRETTESGVPKPLQLRHAQEVARQSLVNVGGVSYPLHQRAALWCNLGKDRDDAVSFEFNRQHPYGDCRFDQDLSFLASRELDDDESNPPIILLERLTWELVASLLFFSRFVQAHNRPGLFRIGLGLSDLIDTQFDWAGFENNPDVDEVLTVWRFKPMHNRVCYEVPHVAFPIVEDDLVQAVTDVIADASQSVKGIRLSATKHYESRLELTRHSIDRVARLALTTALIK